MAANDWPDDRKLVLAAARLGWNLAKLAGCLRDARPIPAEPGHLERKWLPLGQERSETEQLVEYTATIDDLAVELNIQILAQDLPNARRNVDETAAGWLKRAAYDLVVDLLILAVLLWYWPRVRGRQPEGRVFWLYLVLYGGFRFATSFLRLDPVVFAGLQEAQLLGLIYLLAGVPALIWLQRRERRPTTAL